MVEATKPVTRTDRVRALLIQASADFVRLARRARRIGETRAWGQARPERTYMGRERWDHAAAEVVAARAHVARLQRILARAVAPRLSRTAPA